MIGALGGGEAGIAAISTAQAAAQANRLRYSRGREQEADRIGLNTLVNADMDPNAMGRMFERMQRQLYRFSRGVFVDPPAHRITHRRCTPQDATLSRDRRMQIPKNFN